MNTLTDNAIMLRVKAGDVDRMGLLFERYHRPLYGFLFHMTWRREASEDMVQQVFYKMLKYRHTFTGEGEFATWMYQVARNLLKDEAKKQQRTSYHHSLDAFSERPGGEATPGERLESKEAKAGLHQAIKRLTEEHREVLVLHKFQELKSREIAEILDMTEGAVRVRICRAMQELKNIYHQVKN